MDEAINRSVDARSASRAQPINLAARAPIRRGALTITPALRRVAHDDGREQIAEPRVMQVLVALLDAHGQILTRDDLQASCWHGVVVGEDAITRAIGKLRRLCAGLGGAALKLETVTKVGYRLVTASAVPQLVAGAPAASEPLLAVLAFDNLSGDPDLDYFSNGVSEEILHTLARGPGLRVIGRGSSFQFRGAEKAAGRVADALKVTHILDGAVRRSGGRVRISAQLIECANQTTLWSDRFDRDLANIFALQDEIGAAVAAALSLAFTPPPSPHAIQPRVLDLYLRARDPDRVRARRARIELLRQVTELAPDFAAAWAALAEAMAMELRFGEAGAPGTVTGASVRATAETALRLDARSGLAYAALAGLEPFGRYAEREALFRRGVDVSPNDPYCLMQLSWFEYWVGRLRSSLELVERAYAIDPLFPPVADWRAMMTSLVGDYSEGSRQYDALFERWPDRLGMIPNAVGAAATRGDWNRVDAIARQLGDGTSLPSNLKQAFRAAAMQRRPSDADRARLMARMARDLEQTGAVRLGRLFLAYSIGLRREAFETVEASDFGGLFVESGANPAGDASPGLIFLDDPNAAISHDLRFVTLCAKLGLCAYWVSTRRWPDCAGPGALPYDFKAECRRLAAA